MPIWIAEEDRENLDETLRVLHVTQFRHGESRGPTMLTPGAAVNGRLRYDDVDDELLSLLCALGVCFSRE